MPKHFLFFRSSRRLFVVLLVAVPVLFAGFLVSARTWRARDVLTNPGAKASSTVASGIQPHQEAQDQAPIESLEGELITVGPNGFEPTQINRPSGPFVLLIQNRSGTDLGPLMLEAEESGLPTPISKIAEARIDRQRLDYGERLELPPGRYRLRQSENSHWSFGIAITAR